MLSARSSSPTAQVSQKQLGLPQHRRHRAPTSSTRRSAPAASTASRPTSTTTRRTSTRPIPRTATTASSPAACRRLLSSGKGGTHDLKGGFEWFRSTNTGGNSQTSTGYVFYSDYVNNGGVPVFDGQGRLIPQFVPGDVAPLELAGDARREHRHQDHVALRARSLGGEPRLTVDPGVRYERVRSEATGDIVGVDTDTLVPRLAATFDVKGDGRIVLQATYAHYAGKYSEAQFASNTDVANPSLIRYAYTGPAGQGMDFAPGFDLANYTQHHRRHVPDRERVLRRRPALAGDARVHRLARQPDLAARLRQGSPTSRATSRASSRTSSPSTTAPPTSSATASYFGTFDNTVYRNTDEPQRALPGAADAGQLPRPRATCRSPATGRCSCRTKATSRVRPPTSRATRRSSATIPEVFTAGAQLPDRPLRRLPAPQAASVGRLQPLARPLRRRRPVRRCGSTTRA